MKKKLAVRVILFALTAAVPALVIFLVTPLPDEATHPGALVSCNICDRNGNVLRTVLSDEDGTSCRVSLDEISPYVLSATIAAEDRRYYSHWGVDLKASGRAVLQNLKARRIVSGGSTITQQYAKLLFHLSKRSFFNKGKEMLYAFKLERSLGKKKILELYLNRIPYSNQIYGIEAASLTYFDKPSRDLSLAQSAFLAAIPQAPSFYNPYRNRDIILTRQHDILKGMLDTGVIDSKAFDEAVNEEISVIEKKESYLAPHFCDLIQKWLNDKGIRKASKVCTSLDLTIQTEVEELLKEQIRALEEYEVTNGAVVVMDNMTGEILALAGSEDYWGAEGQFNAAVARRQPGSALKPFTYALALERNYSAATLLPDLKTAIPTDNGDFTPENYDRTFHGPVRLRQALACSYNVPAVRILQQIGPEFLLERLRSAGFASLDRNSDFYGVGLTLGSGEVTLLEMVRGYSVFPRGGDWIDDRMVQNVQDSEGCRIDFSQDRTRHSVFSPQIAYLITHILSDREARVPAFGTCSALDLPFPCAAKTGTSKGFRDNWTVGYTSQYTAGVWMGNFDGKEMKKVSGITGAGPLFRNVMRFLHKTSRPADFYRPDGIVEFPVCPSSGAVPSNACPQCMKELFILGREPHERCTVHREVTVDTRTGREASSQCPEMFAKRRVYEVYPPLYAEWMSERRMEMPPPHIETSPDKKEAGISANPVVTYPKDGDIFRIDPILRKEYQIVHLKTVVPESTLRVEWWVDGKCEGETRYPFTFEWLLRKGTHKVYVKADGIKTSETVQFLVD
ncbi:MAG: penicillin-binding protein 1C [Candidatus Xenobiia bacterium LiM19]